MAGQKTKQKTDDTTQFVEKPHYENKERVPSLVLPSQTSPKKHSAAAPQTPVKKPGVISWEKPKYDKNTETPAKYFLKLVRTFTEYSHRLYGEGSCSPEYFQGQYNVFYKDCLALIDNESPTAQTSLEDLNEVALTWKVKFNEFSVDAAVKTKLKDIESEQQSIKALQQSIPVTPKQPSTPEAPKTDLKTKVIQALDAQIARLEEKLTGCFSLFTINVELIQEKIEILKQMKNDVKKTTDENEIKKVLYEITNDNKFLPTNNGLYVFKYDTNKLKQHRIGFIGNAATHDHLAEAFKNLTPKPK